MGYDDRYIPFNFLEERRNTSDDSKDQSLEAIFDVNIPIAKALKVSAQLGLQADKTAVEKWAAEESYYTRKYKEHTRYYDEESSAYRYFLPEGGIVQNASDNFFQYNYKAGLNYDTRLWQKHEIQAFIGSELRKTKTKYLSAKGFGYNPKTLTTKSVILPSTYLVHRSKYKGYEREEAENAYASFYATLSYTYDEKYTVFGSIRHDGSNLFGVASKHKYLPIGSISGAWQASEEPFLQSAKAISHLRLKASYGFQGNIDRHTSPFVAGTYKTVAALSDNTEDILTVARPPNDRLRWEKTENVNTGIDCGLFKDKVDITLDTYSKRGTDLLGSQRLPLETGFGSMYKNASRISNRGFEISIATENIRTAHFSWRTQFNIAHNKSRVEDETFDEADYIPSRAGYPVNAVFVIRTAGIDEDGYPLFWKGGQRLNTVQFFDLYDPYAGDPDLAGLFIDSKLSPGEMRARFTYLGDADPSIQRGHDQSDFLWQLRSHRSCQLQLKTDRDKDTSL